MTKEQILEIFRSLKSKRLFSSDVDKFIEPVKGHEFSINLSFNSARQALGRQIESSYDSGYKADCSIDGEDLDFIVLFSKDQSEFIESLSSGEDFQMNYRVLGFDALYQKPIIGAIANNKEGICATNPSPTDNIT